MTTCYESSTPWVEKYRPKTFDNIVLDETNQIILTNIIEKGYFPNLLLYGPPGTGKTTTIINLVNAFQKKYTRPQLKSSSENTHTYTDADTSQPECIEVQPMLGIGTVVHLNASDERGIDVIRSQICTFVNTKSLFGRGDQLKFIILDEVDYMTKNAQTALRYLINNYTKDSVCTVKFCLICNYVSKIDESLQSDFVKMRFNQLPTDNIITFLNKINTSEQLNLSLDALTNIQRQFGSDIRGMINYMQSNQGTKMCNIIHRNKWKEVLDIKSAQSISIKLNNISKEYCIEKKSMVIQFLNYIIRTQTPYLNSDFLTRIEHAIHSQEYNPIQMIDYISLIVMKWKVESNYKDLA
jgi:replication factor C subunit 3/5